MNTPPPPNYQPPQGQPYYGGPPPQQNSGSGCIKAFGITCGVLVLLGILGVVMSVIWVKNAATNPNSPFHQVMGQAMNQVNATVQGEQIYQAIAKYKLEKGTYPPNLQALVPNYLPSSASLHDAADANSNPSHISWTYIKPGPDSSTTAPMLTQPVSMTVGTQTVNQVIAISVGGQSLPPSTTTMPYGGSSFGGSQPTSGNN